MIASNRISYVLDTSSDYAAISSAQEAIGWRSSATYQTAVYENVAIKDNVVTNSPRPGILCEYGVIKGMVISGNYFKNCGTSQHPSTSTDHKSVITLTPYQITEDIVISNNTIIDINSTGVIDYVLYLRSWVSSTSYTIHLINNFYRIVDPTSLTYWVYTYGTAYFNIYFDERNVPEFTRTLYKQVVEGSVITYDNVRYDAYTSGDGNVWKALGWSSATPSTGTWYQGDQMRRIAPYAGGYIGYVCTADGTPGTWKTFGSISP